MSSQQFSLFPNDRPPPPPPTVVRLIPNPRPRRQMSREDNSLPPQSTPEPPLPSLQSESRSHTPLQFDVIQSNSAESSQSTSQSPPPKRSSIAKMPLPDDDSAPAPLRSMFPTYDPQVPLDRQQYGPSQLSPTHIPRAIVSRQSYYEADDSGSVAESRARSPPMRNYQPGAFTGPRVVQHNTPPPVIPNTSSTEELQGFWKAANGWKASSSEGRVYCLKLTQRKDAPVYTLSSASQPFYSLRMDPTSASANVTLSRYDPHKTFKESGPWHQSLATTLEDESRKLPPNDGLVASLMPTPALKMAQAKANDEVAVMTAEREYARLVWDEDTASNWLAHPALAAPFCVSIERCPAWARTEYTLEHPESNKHLAKLTRDGTGGGWLEVDTSIAAHIEAYYIIDVAVTALMLVAIADGKNITSAPVESFEPPPSVLAMGKESRSSSRLSKLSGKRSAEKTNTKTKAKMEEFEIDLESQHDSLKKGAAKAKEGIDKLPFVFRVLAKMVIGVFKCFIWVLTVAFKVVGGVFKVLYKCVGSKY